MKHWHRCKRWTDHELACPLRMLKEHEDDQPDPEEDFRFERTSRTSGHMVRKDSPWETVGVPDFAKGFPLAIPGVAEVPVGVPALPVPLPDIVGIPFPGVPALDPIADLVRATVAQVPSNWTPSMNELASILNGLQLGRQTSRPDTINAMAEDAIAIELGAGNFLDLLPIAVVPLVKKLLRWQKMAAPRPGVVGTAGPADAISKPSQFRTGQSPHRTATAAHPQTGGRGISKPSPAQTSVRGGYPLAVNMSEYMRGLIARGRR